MPTASLDITIKSIPKVRTIALRHVVESYTAQSPLWTRVFAYTSFNQIQPQPESACFAIFYDPEHKPSDVDTEVCLPIHEDAVIPDDTKEFEVSYKPEVPRAACVIHKGSYSDTKDVYDNLFAWIVQNQEHVCGPVREIYHVGLGNNGDDESKLVTEIVVPLASDAMRNSEYGVLHNESSLCFCPLSSIIPRLRKKRKKVWRSSPNTHSRCQYIDLVSWHQTAWALDAYAAAVCVPFEPL